MLKDRKFSGPTTANLILQKNVMRGVYIVITHGEKNIWVLILLQSID